MHTHTHVHTHTHRRTTGPCSPSARASSRPWRPRARPQTSRRPALPQRWMCPNWKAQDGETRTWTWGWGMWGKRWVGMGVGTWAGVEGGRKMGRRLGIGVCAPWLFCSRCSVFV
eukprot:1158570-Pelagomonas_calceolata.AAC.4